VPAFADGIKLIDENINAIAKRTFLISLLCLAEY